LAILKIFLFYRPGDESRTFRTKPKLDFPVGKKKEIVRLAQNPKAAE